MLGIIDELEPGSKFTSTELIGIMKDGERRRSIPARSQIGHFLSGLVRQGKLERAGRESRAGGFGSMHLYEKR